MRVPPEEIFDNCVPNDPREDCQPIDANYPGRWYHPPGMSSHKIHYRIPADLECSHCTLLWFWPTANSEAYDAASYSCYNKVLTAANWTRFDFCGWACSDSKCPVPYVQDTTAPRAPDPNAGPGYEEFRNCADIRVSLAGPAPAPSPAPGVGTCNPLGDCSQEGWCDIDAYVAWCAGQGAQGICPSPFCQQAAPAPVPAPAPAPAPAPSTSLPAPAPSPGTMTCVAVPGLNNGVP